MKSVFHIPYILPIKLLKMPMRVNARKHLTVQPALHYQSNLTQFIESNKSDSAIWKSDIFCMIRIVESDFLKARLVQTFRLI